MKVLMSLGILITLSLIGGSVEARAAGCEPVGNVRFICDQLGPEDLAACARVGLGSLVWYGGERRPSASSTCAIRARPCFSRVRRLESGRTRKRMNRVPGRSALKATSSERTAYICALDRTRSIPSTSFIMATGSRSKFSNSTPGPKAPTLTWIGCAVAPDPIGLNSVVGLSDGGFITTNFLPRGS